MTELNVGAFEGDERNDVMTTREAFLNLDGRMTFLECTHSSVLYENTGPGYLTTYGIPSGTPTDVSTAANLKTQLEAGGSVRLTADVTLTIDIAWADNTTLWSENGSSITFGAYDFAFGDYCEMYGITALNCNAQTIKWISSAAQHDAVIACNSFQNCSQAVYIGAIAGAGYNTNIAIEHNRFDGCSYAVYGIRGDDVTIKNNWMINSTNRNIEIKGGDNYVITGNRIDQGVTGINFLLNAQSGLGEHSSLSPLIANNYITNISEEGIGFDGTTNVAGQTAIIDQFTINSISGTAAIPVINVDRVDALNKDEFWVTWCTGTNAGKAFNQLNGVDQGTTLDITLSSMTQEEFNAVSTSDTVNIGYIVKDGVIRNNIVEALSGTGINLYGVTYNTKVYENTVIIRDFPNPYNVMNRRRAGISMKSLAGIVASNRFTNHNTTTSVVISPSAYNEVYNNRVVGGIESIGTTWNGSSIVLTEDPIYHNRVYNNNSEVFIKNWTSINASPRQWDGEILEDITDWTGNSNVDYLPINPTLKESNAYETSVVTKTLPPAFPSRECVYHRDNATYALRVDPDGTEYFDDSTAGKYKSLDTDGGFLHVKCYVQGVWHVMASNGTITDET
ncbi:MAG: hypothetical protein ACQ9ET_03355 [Nitrosomonadaceae bacterium]